MGWVIPDTSVVVLTSSPTKEIDAAIEPHSPSHDHQHWQFGAGVRVGYTTDLSPRSCGASCAPCAPPTPCPGLSRTISCYLLPASASSHQLLPAPFLPRPLEGRTTYKEAAGRMGMACCELVVRPCGEMELGLAERH